MPRPTLRSIVLATALLAGGAALVPSAASAQPAAVPADRAAVQAATDQVEALARTVATGARRPSDVAPALAALSRSRRTALLELAHSRPQDLADVLLPAGVLTTLHGVAGNALERPTTLRGTYTVQHREDGHGVSTFTPQVRTGSGTVDVVYGDGRLPRVRPGSQVAVQAYQLDATTAVAYAAGSTSASSTTTATSTASTTPLGPLNVAVILADFSDSSTSLDPNVARTAFTGSPGSDVDSWYAQNSYGRASLNPSFLGPFRLSDTTSGGSCPDLTVASDHLLAAASSSTTFSQYRRFMLVFNCTGYGASTSVGETQVQTPQGAVPGAETVMDVSFLGDRYGYAHELAHNLGDLHAAYFDCAPSAFVAPTRFDPGCASAEYGDEFDTLGATLSSPRALPHLDAFHKANAGWFTSGNDVTLSTPGTYTYKLLPYETATSGVLALTLPRGSSGTAFTLEYRQPVGTDAWMTSSDTTYCGGRCTATQGPLLRLVMPQSGSGGGSDTQAIDTTPNSIASSGYYPIEDDRDGALLPGRTFTDPEYGISVTTQSADSTGATVTVTVPAAATCTRTAPTVALASSATQTASAGQTLSWTMHVTSNDSSSCPAQSFRYAGGKMTGTTSAGRTASFTATASPDAFSLGAGASTDVTVTLRPEATVTTGAYTFSGTAAGGVGWLRASSLEVADVAAPNVTFQVASPADSTAPAAPSSATAQALGSGAAAVTWAPSSDNVGVAGYRVLVDNAYLYYTAEPGLTARPLSAGATHTVAVQAFDRQGNLSPATTSSVTVPTKTDTVAPVSPGDPSADVTDRTIALRWNASSDNVGVIGYVVAPFGTWVPAGTTSLTVNDLATATTYALHVQAVDAAGNYSPAASSSLTVTTAKAGGVAPTRPGALVSPVATTKGGITLSWGASSSPAGVAGYRVYRNGRPWATVSGTSWTDPASDLYSTGAGYQFTVQAYDAAGNVSAPTPVLQTISPNTTAADTTAPTGSGLTSPTSGSTVSGTVSLAVSPSDDVRVSTVEWYVDGRYVASSSAAPYTWAWATSSTWNGTHSVYARVYDAAGNYSTQAVTTVTVANGAADTTAPTAPAGLVASAAGATQVNLTWGAASDNVGVTGYTVYRNGTAVGTTTGTSWSDTSVSASTSYSYAVTASDAAGNTSPTSSPAAVTTPAAPDTSAPTTPTGLSATAASSTQVNLQWAAASDNVGVTGYTVFRNGTAVGSTTGTSWSDTGVAASTTYSYAVSASDAAGNTSASSSPVSVTTPSAGPTATPSTTGVVSGTVTSKSNGAPLANVKVAWTVNGVKQSTTTSTAGAYTATGLPAGSVSLTFSAKGVKSQTRTVTVTAGQTTTLNVAL